MTAIRVLSACGLLSAALVAVGGLANVPALVGAAGVVMAAANLYGLVVGR